MNFLVALSAYPIHVERFGIVFVVGLGLSASTFTDGRGQNACLYCIINQAPDVALALHLRSGHTPILGRAASFWVPLFIPHFGITPALNTLRGAREPWTCVAM